MRIFKSVQIRLFALAVGLVTLFVSGFYLLNAYNVFSLEADYASPDASLTEEYKFPEPTLLYGMVVDDFHVVENVVRRNQRFADLFEGHYVSPQILKQLNFVPRQIFDFRKISSNKKYTLITRQDSLQSVKAIVYEPNPIDYIIFHLDDSLMVEHCQREIIVEEKKISGVIQSTLSETIEAMGGTPQLTNMMVDIFAWQIDFQRLQEGDKFKLIYEQNTVDGNPIGIGQIKAAHFEHFESDYFAIPFDQGDGLDYFDEKGNSLRKALLKYPIEFSRISSRYSHRRFHPVAKVFRAHLGTDFSAPTGTPIRTVGDGIVVEAQYKANNGNYVKIRHNSTYTTQYLHMHKIASGIRPGVRVQQGQTIGFVGSTGLATGSHLCYRFWRNGVQVDALRVELPPSQPVKKENEESFIQIKQQVMSRLESIAFPSPTEITVAGK
jgi:murein DD-endopeptidase MepM/ murein hydrolase activator NlpD